jgi:hypothetical protein
VDAVREDRKDSMTWKQFVADHEDVRLVLAARAILPRAIRENADAMLIRMLRDHHLRLEALLADAIREHENDWEARLGYRGNVALVVCRPDVVNHLAAVALSLVAELSGQPQAALTTVGLAREDAVDVAAHRPGLPDHWPTSTDLQGLAVERAISLVEDVGDAGQVLLCGDLVEAIDLSATKSLVPAARAELELKPRKNDRLVLHADLSRIAVAQITWDHAGPGDLTNRRNLGHELKRLQRQVADLVEFFAGLDGSMVLAYSGSQGDATLSTIQEEVLAVSERKVAELVERWDATDEAKEIAALTARVERVDRDYGRLAERFRDLQNAILVEDSGSRDAARAKLQNAWMDCRFAPTRLLDAINAQVSVVYA